MPDALARGCASTCVMLFVCYAPQCARRYVLTLNALFVYFFFFLSPELLELPWVELVNGLMK